MTLDLDIIRAQFPALALQHDGRPRVYFDNPAGTQVPKQVLSRMATAMVECNANMHGNFRTSREATELVDQAHLAMADFYNAVSEREVVFGPNMTTLTFTMARVLGPRFQPGDELITTHMEHDGNNTPWRTMAAERGMVIKTLPFDRTTYEVDLDELDSLITERTRFSALNFSSNILGTINPVKQMCTRLRAVGALTYVDAVQYAPHGPIDVQDLGWDFLVSSAYKYYGPHQGVLWGREELLQSLPAYKLRVVNDVLPGKFETGTQSLEGQAGTIGALEYLQWLGTTMGAEHMPSTPGLRPRTRELHAALAAMADYEHALSGRLIAGLQQLDGVEVRGITDPAAFDRRVPTVSITKPGMVPAELATFLDDHGAYVWDGHSYG
ncbi:MAG: cysteine desulfurase-like protein, partial [Ilumatobacteraceae bacterium]|nr:cysteine desulfurase-like protein [Ilumatobacteraceae bacterium]